MKFLIPISGIFLFTSFLFLAPSAPKGGDKLYFDSTRDTVIERQMFNVRDTVYTVSERILVINLKRYSAVVRSVSGEDYEFKISSGTTTLDKGMLTPEGLYTVLFKTPRAISRQFDNTPMLFWIGFHNSIGLHGLETDGYYRYLGKKNSSHGCVRVARRDIKHVYKMVSEGTPVLVHSGKSAIVIAFADSVSPYVELPFIKLSETMKYRQRLLATGDYFLYDHPKLLITRSNTTNAGLPIGHSDSISTNQKAIVKKSYL